MLKKTIKYTDFNGVEKEKNFYFNLTKPELMEMPRSPLYDVQSMVERLKGVDDPSEVLTPVEMDEIQSKVGGILRNLVILSYGVKSDDGERFTKRIGDRQFGAGEDFVESMAYSELYVELVSEFSNFVNFVRAIVPADIQANIDNSPELKELASTEVDNITPIVNK